MHDRRFATLAVVLSWAAGCGQAATAGATDPSGDRRADATVAEDVGIGAEAGRDAAETLGAPDAADAIDAADSLPEALPVANCPPAGGLVRPDGLIPVPWQYVAGGAAFSVSAISANPLSTAAGLTDAAALAAGAGVPFHDAPAAGDWVVATLPASGWPDFAARCALGTLPAGSYSLFVDAQGARILAVDDDGVQNAFRTLAQLVVADPAAPGSATVRPATVLDRPTFALRGVVESYYGDPWTHETRLAMLPILADLKFNHYVYGPKFDLMVDTLWRLPFQQQDLDDLHEVATVAKQNRIHPCLQMHPSAVPVFSSADDFNTIVGKFQDAATQGFECFILAFDDMPTELSADDQGKYAGWVEGQVDWANRIGAVLHQEYPDALLAFVPNDYWSGSSGATTDLVYVGAHLDPMWAIAWTGPQVSSPTIADADADAIAVTLRRKPFLADNHPVVAPPAQTGVVDLGALEGRSPTLADHVLGVVYNPMPLARASLPGLATAADYAWNSAAYDPDRSLATAAAWLAGGTAADAFLTLCRADLSPVFHPEQAPDAAAAVNAFLAPGADLATLSTALRTLLVAFSAVPAALAADAAATPGLTDEVKPWSDKLGAYGDAGQIAVDLLLAQAAGQPVDATRLADLHARAAALTAQNAKPTGTVMSGFLATALARLDGGDAADP